MTETPVPPTAVQIAADALRYGLDNEDNGYAAVTALARAGWLCDPAEVAALEAEVASLRAQVAYYQGKEQRAALDAAPDETTAEDGA